MAALSVSIRDFEEGVAAVSWPAVAAAAAAIVDVAGVFSTIVININVAAVSPAIVVPPSAVFVTLAAAFVAVVAFKLR